MSDYSVPDSWLVDKFDIELASGGKVQARKVSMEDVIEMGLIDNLDFFGSIAGKGKGAKKKQLQIAQGETAITPDQIKKMMGIVNKVILKGVLQPAIHPVPENDGERKDGLVYVDHIPYDDRLEIFQKVFLDDLGGEEFAQFRDESVKVVGALAEKSEVQRPSKPTTRDVSLPPESVLPGS